LFTPLKEAMTLIDDKPGKKQTDENIDEKNKITSASIKNAHATGDGAVQKSDELITQKDKEELNNDTNTY
jgi:hypothetical protein